MLRKGFVLGALLALGGALPGCLVPQEDKTFAALGPTRNHPPRIMEELMPVSRVKTGSASCPVPSIDFSAWVEELDTGDDTHYRFYIDWNKDTNKFPFESGVVSLSNATPAASQTQRTIPTLTVPISATSPLASLGTHLVELWVTDGYADVADSRLAEQPPGAAPNNPSYVATYAWVVNITSGCTP